MLHPNFSNATRLDEWSSCGQTLGAKIAQTEHGLSCATRDFNNYTSRATNVRNEMRLIPNHRNVNTESMCALDAAALFASNMATKTSLRAARRQYSIRAATYAERMQRLDGELAELKSQLAMDKSSHTETIQSFNEKLKQLPIKLELRAITRLNKAIYFYFHIGEHIIRPAKSSIDYADLNYCEHEDDFVEAFYERGVKRPPMNFIMKTSLNDTNRLGSVGLSMSFFDPINQQSRVGLDSDGLDVVASHMNEFPHDDERIPSRESFRVYPHPHLRGDYHPDKLDSSFCASACTGSFHGPLRQAIESNNPIAIGILLMQYFQSFDAADEYGRMALQQYDWEDLVSEDEVSDSSPVVKEGNNPVWIPQFIVAGDKVQFLNKPNGFDYAYSIETWNSEGDCLRMDQTNTANEPQTIPDIDRVFRVQVCTTAGECGQVRLRR